MYRALIFDAQNLCTDYSAKDASRDLAQLEHRVKHEGTAFCTNILPKLGKHFLRSLDLGGFTPISGFSRMKGGTYPNFLKGLFKSIFERSGFIKQHPDINSIKMVHQITVLYSKLEGVCNTEELLQKQINEFVALDEDLSYENNEKTAEIIKSAQIEIAHIFEDFDPFDIVPSPGPGAECNHLENYKRYTPHLVPPRANSFYDFSSYHFVNDRHLFDSFDTYREAEFVEPFSRLEAVPKNTAAWRLICIVANGLMWLQQGLKAKLYEHIESHPLTKGFVNFTDQCINQELALRGSANKYWSTLDMKEASDRIMKDVIHTFFAGVPVLRDALLSLTEDTIRIKNPDGTYRFVGCKKFAPMGSALCFPIMSIVHYVLARCAIKHSRKPYDKRPITVYVYGDDLIVQTKYVGHLYNAFPQFSLKFNEAKSYRYGNFRESCGLDAYNGTDITPLKIKKLIPKGGLSPEVLEAYLSYEHTVYKNNLKHCSRYLRAYIVRNLPKRVKKMHGTLPACSLDSPILGWRRSGGVVERWNRILDKKSKFLFYDSMVHSRYANTWVKQTPMDKHRLYGWTALLRWFVQTPIRESQQRLVFKPTTGGTAASVRTPEGLKTHFVCQPIYQSSI
jgi:hypothetical protein